MKTKISHGAAEFSEENEIATEPLIAQSKLLPLKTEVEIDEINVLTERVIGCALNVHKALGPGLLESVYESALSIELKEAGLKFKRQHAIPVSYKSALIGEFRIDLVVEDQLVLEIKSVERMDSVFEAQLLSYLKMGGYRVGLLINFNSKLLKSGIKRRIL